MRPILFQHHRGPLYALIAVADDSSNVGPRPGRFCVYYSLERCTYHIRPLEEFYQLVELPNGDWVPRFKLATSPEDVKA